MFHPETRAQNGDTALAWAADRGHVDCVRQLLEAGAEKNPKNEVRFLFPLSSYCRLLVTRHAFS